MSGDLNYLSAAEAIEKFNSRSLSPIRLMQAVINAALAFEQAFDFSPYTLDSRIAVGD